MHLKWHQCPIGTQFCAVMNFCRAPSFIDHDALAPDRKCVFFRHRIILVYIYICVCVYKRYITYIFHCARWCAKLRAAKSIDIHMFWCSWPLHIASLAMDERRGWVALAVSMSANPKLFEFAILTDFHCLFFFFCFFLRCFFSFFCAFTS